MPVSCLVIDSGGAVYILTPRNLKIEISREDYYYYYYYSYYYYVQQLSSQWLTVWIRRI
jgi:hypothetical protein